MQTMAAKQAIKLGWPLGPNEPPWSFIVAYGYSPDDDEGGNIAEFAARWWGSEEECRLSDGSGIPEKNPKIFTFWKKLIYTII
jgi:hypothetical protein